jgi:hypothetical protein
VFYIEGMGSLDEYFFDVLLSEHARMVFKFLGCLVKEKNNKSLLAFLKTVTSSLKVVLKAASEFLFLFPLLPLVNFL